MLVRRAMFRQAGRSKYGAMPTTVDGIRFHSAKEAKRYGELKLLEQAGEIAALELQPKIALSVGAARLGEYRADFRYLEPTPTEHGIRFARIVVEDVKGVKTPLYRWKKKHVEAQYGIQIREI